MQQVESSDFLDPYKISPIIGYIAWYDIIVSSFNKLAAELLDIQLRGPVCVFDYVRASNNTLSVHRPVVFVLKCRGLIYDYIREDPAASSITHPLRDGNLCAVSSCLAPVLRKASGCWAAREHFLGPTEIFKPCLSRFGILHFISPCRASLHSCHTGGRESIFSLGPGRLALC